MKWGIISALGVSLVLVGGALFYRLNDSAPTQGLVAVTSEQNSEEYHNNLLKSFLEPSGQGPSQAEALTTTDLVGRQLIMDYLALAQDGQASSANLNILAERYVNSLPSLLTPTKKTALDLKIVSSNRPNFLAYSSQITKIYQAYGTGLLGAYSGNEVSLNEEGSMLFIKMKSVYADTAQKLQALAVPSYLAEPHLELINIYIENAAAMGAIAQVKSDPASSFAGLVAMKSNTEREGKALSNIEEILNRNGI